MKRSPTVATNATTQAISLTIWKAICWFIVVRSLLLAHSAITPPIKLLISRATCRFIPEKNFLVANNALSPPHNLLISRHTWRFRICYKTGPLRTQRNSYIFSFTKSYNQFVKLGYRILRLHFSKFPLCIPQILTEWSSTKRSSLKLLPPRELLSRARDHSQRIYPSGHLSIYPPHIYPPFIYPLPPTTYPHPSDHSHTIQEYVIIAPTFSWPSLLHVPVGKKVSQDGGSM